MSDPLYPEREPRRDPRYNTDDLRRMDDSASSASTSGMLWVIGGVAAVVVVGMLLFGLSDDTRTANRPVPETSGQGTRPPVVPTPPLSGAPSNPAPSTPAPASPGANPSPNRTSPESSPNP